MKLILTPEQTAQIEPHLIPDRALLGRVTREQYDPQQPVTAGRLIMELGAVRESALPALRLAIGKAVSKKK